jgi:hypothetical protein
MSSSNPEIRALLGMVGARPCGPRRYNCPDCGSLRTVSVDEARGLFHCHHAGCGFSGDVATLRRRLGLRREWLPRDQYLRLKREQAQAQAAAERLALAVHRRRMEVVELLEALAESERLVQLVGPDTDNAWDLLELVDRRRPLLITELVFLENATAAAVAPSLAASQEEQDGMIAQITFEGGVSTYEGKFVPL